MFSILNYGAQSSIPYFVTVGASSTRETSCVEVFSRAGFGSMGEIIAGFSRAEFAPTGEIVAGVSRAELAATRSTKKHPGIGRDDVSKC